MNGTISAAGRDVVPSYGVAGLDPSGTAGVVMSDAFLGCLALTAEYSSSSLPLPGTYLAVGIPTFDEGVADENFVYFAVAPEKGTDFGGGGSNAGTVEVLDGGDTVVTIRVEYDDTLSDGNYIVSGDFTVSRCP